MATVDDVAETGTPDVVVLGAGMVGVSCALELQRRGLRVLLMERRAPGLETSYGNAGVLARTSIVPMNHPGFIKTLPRLLRNDTVQLRYNPRYLIRNMRWATSFVRHARQTVFEKTLTALDGLIQLSIGEHLRLMQEAGVLQRLRSTGWLLAYRSQAGFGGGAPLRAVYERFGIRTEVLSPDDIAALEPALAPIFARGLLIEDAWSVDSPGNVVAAYAEMYRNRGGALRQAEARAVRRAADGVWEIVDANGKRTRARRVVVAMGPWSKHLLASLGIALPLAFERGYHLHFTMPNGPVLQRPVYDTAGGYVCTPTEHGMRLTSGVELNDLDAPPNPIQLTLVEQAARQAMPLGERIEATAWMGRRPTLPDSRPMIGEVPGHRGLWLAVGHQHIGFNTGPGTASLLAALMTGNEPPLHPEPFAPDRFL